jgi:enoyl-CoA hydratase/carnithine racemase
VERDPDGQIKLEQRGHLLLIGIDRPEKRNGFTPKIFSELAAAYTRLEATAELRCGVLYAEGEHFTAGLDMPKIAPLRREGKPLIPPGEVDPFGLRAPLRTKPMIVALQGICFTVAIELMLAADLAIAAENCRFSQLEVKRGIMAGCGATFRMVARAGWGNAMKILLTGDEFTAAEAYRCNFVQEVVPVGQELPRAIALAERIAQQAPLAVQATLDNARIAVDEGWQAAAARIPETQRRLYNTEDAQEGVQSFMEKRAARFVGR